MKIERALVINLEPRTDRWEALTKRWEEVGPSSIPLVRVDAVNGQDPEVQALRPKWLLCGAGGWGCYLSQRKCLEIAAESSGHTLILEDDAWPVEKFAELLAIALPFLPETAGWYYLGGQHLKLGENEPRPLVEKTNFRWVQPYNVNRMHAYVVSPEAARWVLDVLDEELNRDPEEAPRFKTNWQKDRPNNHIDHRMGWIMETAFSDPSAVPFSFAALDPWIIHQAASFSNIKNREVPHRPWHRGNKFVIQGLEGQSPPAASLPKVSRVTREPRDPAGVSRRMEAKAAALRSAGHRNAYVQGARFSKAATRNVSWARPRLGGHL